MTRTANTQVVLLLAAGIIGCGDSTPTGVRPSPGVEILSARAITDTVTAQPTENVTVIVRGTDGAPLATTAVRFETVSLNEEFRKGPWAVLCPEGTLSCGSVGATSVSGQTSLPTFTDAQGRAAARVRLGTFAGNSWIRIVVPDQQMTDSVSLDIRAGAAARVNFTARDTSVVPGARVRVQGFATDRFYNPRADAVSITSGCGSGVAEYDAATSTATARGFGVCVLRASVGTIADSARLLVLPAGRLVTWSTTSRLQLVNTDGTAPRTLFNGASFQSSLGTFPRFGPGGSVLLHSGPTAAGMPQLIARGDTSAAAPASLATTMTEPAYARELADGSILFVGSPTAAFDYGVYRTNAAGATPTLVQPIANFADTYGAADISPDGTRLVYVANATTGPNVLRVLNLTTGVITELGVQGESPRWSPAGDQIAYFRGESAQNVRGTVSVLRLSDGTSRQLSDRVLVPGFAWSPDGLYIIGSTDPGAVIIRVSDGVAVPTRLLSATAAREFDWR